MIPNESGCFQPLNETEHIDGLNEAAAVVDDIQQGQGDGSTTPVGEDYLLTVQSLTQVASEYARRIRLLTWTVVAIVVYLVLKEAQ